MIIIGIALFHIIFTLLFTLTKDIEIKLLYTNQLYEYPICQYSKYKILSDMFNIIILSFGFLFSHATRNIKKLYKEEMRVPTYTYVIFTIFMEIITGLEGINIVIQDLFNAVGTTINILIV
eukprot:jgi/Orpsp1_1/1182530/evm.model.c7180000081662.1